MATSSEITSGYFVKFKTIFEEELLGRVTSIDLPWQTVMVEEASFQEYASLRQERPIFNPSLWQERPIYTAYGSEAQKVFDKLSECYSVHWDETTIVITNEIRVCSPYDPDCVTGGVPAANDHVRGLLLGLQTSSPGSQDPLMFLEEARGANDLVFDLRIFIENVPVHVNVRRLTWEIENLYSIRRLFIPVTTHLWFFSAAALSRRHSVHWDQTTVEIAYYLRVRNPNNNPVIETVPPTSGSSGSHLVIEGTAFQINAEEEETTRLTQAIENLFSKTRLFIPLSTNHFLISAAAVILGILTMVGYPNLLRWTHYKKSHEKDIDMDAYIAVVTVSASILAHMCYSWLRNLWKKFGGADSNVLNHLIHPETLGFVRISRMVLMFKSFKDFRTNLASKAPATDISRLILGQMTDPRLRTQITLEIEDFSDIYYIFAMVLPLCLKLLWEVIVRFDEIKTSPFVTILIIGGRVCCYIWILSIIIVSSKLWVVTCRVKKRQINRFATTLTESSCIDASHIIKQHKELQGIIDLASTEYQFFMVGLIVSVTVSLYISLHDILRLRSVIVFGDCVELIVTHLVNLVCMTVCLLSALSVSDSSQQLVEGALAWHALLVNPSKEGAGLIFGSQTRSVQYYKSSALAKYVQGRTRGFSILGWQLDRSLIFAAGTMVFSFFLVLLGKL